MITTSEANQYLWMMVVRAHLMNAPVPHCTCTPAIHLVPDAQIPDAWNPSWYHDEQCRLIWIFAREGN